MRRLCGLGLGLLLLLLGACDTGPFVQVRLFCDRYNRLANHRAHLSLNQFVVEALPNGTAFVCSTDSLLFELTTNEQGQVCTVSVVGLPEGARSAFVQAALWSLQALCPMPVAEAERLLLTLQVGEPEVLGMASLKKNGFALAYAANAAGRYFRMSVLRLTNEPALPTLREPLPAFSQTAAYSP